MAGWSASPASKTRPALAAIYAPFVRDTAVTFEETVPTAEAMAERIESTLRTLPWLTLEEGGRPVGYAYASPHRARASYRWSVDVAVYLAPEARGRGGGRALYGALLDLLTRQRYATAYAGIALPNAASVGLHEAMGFRPVGVYAGVGFKLGAWHDVGWWSRELAPRAAPPPEPISLAMLSSSERGLWPA